MTNQIPLGLSDYQSYRNLPPLAGLCSMEDAQRVGMSVEECVRRLKRYHLTLLRRLHQISHPPHRRAGLRAEDGVQPACVLCAEHAAALRQRVGEMREPPLGFEVVPDPHLEPFFDEILAAPDTGEFLVGLYELALPALGGPRPARRRHESALRPVGPAPVPVCGDRSGGDDGFGCAGD